MNFKPMLSASLDGVDLSTLNYPLLLSPKLDGVRCIIWEGVAYSRNAKPIRNRFVQEWAKKFHNLDGELIVGDPTSPHCLNDTQSGVMSYEGSPDFYFHMFDCPDHDGGFMSRLLSVQAEHQNEHRIEPVPHVVVDTHDKLSFWENLYLDQGYEGVMLRAPNGPYKNGRSTLREGYLMKLKRFQDGEAVVTGLEEGHINENELERDELGRAKRSKDSAGLRPSGMVGTILARDPVWGDLRIAPGTMTRMDRIAHWKAYSDPNSKIAPAVNIVGKTIHWRSFGYGVKDKPRFPRFYGVREDV